MEKLRIVSDGTSVGTTIITEQGERIMDVTKVVWELDAHTGVAVAHLTLANVPVDVQGRVEDME